MKRILLILFLCLNVIGCGQSLRDNFLRQDMVRALPDSLRKKADISWVNGQLDILTIWANNNFATPDLFNGYATEGWVNQQNFLKNGYTPSTTYVTAQYVNDNFITPDLLAGYATQGWVNNKNYTTLSAVRSSLNFDEMIQQYNINITGSASETENWVMNQGYITSQSLAGYATQDWVNSQGFMTGGGSGFADSLTYATTFNLDSVKGNIYSILSLKSALGHTHGQYLLKTDSLTLFAGRFGAINDSLQSFSNWRFSSSFIDSIAMASKWYVDTARLNIWNNLSLKAEAGHTHAQYFPYQDTLYLHFVKFFEIDTALGNRAYTTHNHSNYFRYTDTAYLFAQKFYQRDTAISNRAYVNHTHSKTVRVPQTYAISGEIKVPSGDTDFINPFFISLPSGQTANLVSCRYKINSGTSATVKLQKNGSDITGFTSISVSSTAASATPTAVSLANNDMISLVVTGVSGTPKNMSFTIFVEYSF